MLVKIFSWWIVFGVICSDVYSILWIENFTSVSYGLEYVKFIVYTELNQSGFVYSYENFTSLNSSILNKNVQTKVIVHGWNYNDQWDWPCTMKNNYLARKNYNVIIVKWSSQSEYTDYDVIATNRTISAGQKVGKFLEFLVQNRGIALKDVHLIGHSLGAHVSGLAGAYLISNVGTVGRITGLDPANPYTESGVNRLNSSNAEFVDVIHTCGSMMVGIEEPIGHADFYPNGGDDQPGCPNSMLSLFEKKQCAHARSYELMAESIKYPDAFLANKCDSWENYSRNECKNNEISLMGAEMDTNSRGLFYLRTNKQSPFGIRIFMYKICDHRI